MPYVEVWVDDPECEGHCDQSHQLKKRRDCAAGFLFDGDVNAALDVLTKGDLPGGFKVTAETQAKYRAWSTGNLDGFAGPAALNMETTP